MKHRLLINYPNYFVTDRGGVWSCFTNRYLKQQTDKRGYKVVKLLGKNRTVHRLIASAFLGDIVGKTVNHVNGIKDDNRPENLEICTNVENMRHAYSTGIRSNPFGEDANNSKLSYSEVKIIRKYLSIISNANLGLMFGVSRSTISKIRSGVNWRKE